MEEIRKCILKDLDRGYTYFMAEGLFGGQPKIVIFTVIYKERTGYIGTFDPGN